MVYFKETPTKIDNWGYPPFKETPISTHTISHLKIPIQYIVAYMITYWVKCMVFILFLSYFYMFLHMGVSINGGTSKWLVYNGKSH